MPTNKKDEAAQGDGATAANEPAGDLSAIEQANEQGYFGEVPDKTPNEAYSVAGVTSGTPTPETQPAAAPGTEGANANEDGAR